ncbi:MAG: hypothetical protein ACRDL5_10335 [Solirubrobacteraceae bacterium]
MPHPPPPFADRSRSAQALLAIALPGAIGAVAGVLLGISGIAYAAISVLAGVGAYLSGLEHRGGWDGADRGLVAGAAYGIGLLIAHAIAGTHATVALGSFPPLLVVVTALVGMLLTAAGATGREAVADDAPGR